MVQVSYTMCPRTTIKYWSNHSRAPGLGILSWQGKGQLPAQGNIPSKQKSRELAGKDCFSHSETPGEMVYLAGQCSKQMFGESISKATLQKGELSSLISPSERPHLTALRREASTHEHPKATLHTLFPSDNQRKPEQFDLWMLSASMDTQRSTEQPIKDVIKLPKPRKADGKAAGLFSIPPLPMIHKRYMQGSFPRFGFNI